VNADPKGKFVYVPDCGDNRVSGFQVNPADAALTPLAGSPFTVGPDNTCGGLAVSKKLVMFALGEIADGTNDVQALRRNKKTGVLTKLGGTQSSGTLGASTGGLDPTGRFLAVVGPDGTDQLRSFSINPDTGAISLVDTEPAEFGADVTGLVFVRP
jgi:6-phosphogluconolactonase (cycloisomerase 2 family)